MNNNKHTLNNSLNISAKLTSFALCITLIACGSDGGTTAEDNSTESSSTETSIVINTFEDLPNCNSKREGNLAYIKDDKIAYVCEDGSWHKDVSNNTSGNSGDNGANESSDADATDTGSAINDSELNGKFVDITSASSIEIIQYIEANPTSPPASSSSNERVDPSEEEARRVLVIANYGDCTESKDGKGASIFLEDESAIYYICKNKHWEVTDQMTAAIGECNEDTQGSLGAIYDNAYRPTYYICNQENWEYVPRIIVEHGICNESKKDSVVHFSSPYMMQYHEYYICSNGEWEETTEFVLKNGKCTQDKENQVVSYSDYTTLYMEQSYICRSGEWIDKEEWLHSACNESNENPQSIEKNTYICNSGTWTLIGEDCNSDLQGIVEEVFNESTSNFSYYICKDNKWAQASILEAEYGLCDENKEGEIAISDQSNTIYYICHNKEWEEIEICDDSKENEIFSSKEYVLICQNGSWIDAGEKSQVILEYGICDTDNNGIFASVTTNANECSIIDYPNINECLIIENYVCKNGEWQEATQVEVKYGLCDSEKEYKVVCVNEISQETLTLTHEYYMCTHNETWEVADTKYITSDIECPSEK
ncbi:MULTISPECIES: hypothetical protein [unclassified Fibrobacter]|uniref:hypothetical protein n=1 Tax=unclassified Fibrobacter TaxID=2634177 RepID=UPI000916C49B|nr:MULTISPECIES: hypothetical protein [unclassified Fibrobacter]OWV08247.1 hypothetical protein B7993_01040 [Fibrobacter sp. UWH3]SHL20309.1 hypothetical protein SAMN05720765_1117 [Fibrobacter sp. UWH6]